jgi:DNA-binding LacI/PurR family transcriptional regulator
VDKDQGEIGRLLSRKLIETGHQRIGVVLRDRRGAGDDLMMDAITHEIMNAGLGSGALVARSVPSEQALIALAIRNLLSTPQRPTGIICRNRMILTTAAQICTELGLRPSQEIVLALCDAPTGPDDDISIPCIRPTVELDAAGEGKLLAQMLLQQATTPRPQAASRLIQVVGLKE